MKWLLSTFSSDKRFRILVWLSIILFGTLIFDHLIFAIFLPVYDESYHVGSVNESNDIFIVGTSHTEWAIDRKSLSRLTGLKVGVYSIPASGMRLRYEAIKQRLLLKAPPRLIILETSRYCLNSKRYMDRGTTPMFWPYYHVGLFRNFLDEEGKSDLNWFWKKIFRSYSLNGQFTMLTEPMLIGKTLAERFLSDENYARLQEKLGFSKSISMPQQPIFDERVAIWKKTRDSVGPFSNVPDAEPLRYFNKILSLVETEHIPMILLEPPLFHFDDENGDDGFGNVRHLLKSKETRQVKYLYIDIGNKSILFHDASHLDSAYGQSYFTKLLAQKLKTFSF